MFGRQKKLQEELGRARTRLHEFASAALDLAASYHASPSDAASRDAAVNRFLSRVGVGYGRVLTQGGVLDGIRVHDPRGGMAEANEVDINGEGGDGEVVAIRW